MAWRANSGDGNWSAGVLRPRPHLPNADGGFVDTANYRFRNLKPLAEKLGIEKLNFQICAERWRPRRGTGSVKEIQAHLGHSRADATDQ